MTCFWDGILQNLKDDDFQIAFKCNKPNNINFVKLLKDSLNESFHDKSKDINWNGEKLTKQQIKENFEHIKDYNPKSIYGGYWCSTCDPFLILVCILFRVNINHNYCGHLMKYTILNPRKTLNFKSNSGHFMAR